MHEILYNIPADFWYSRFMGTMQYIQYVTHLHKKAVQEQNWEAAERFLFLLYLSYKELSEKQQKVINSLRRRK
jgi:hypothetical protein